MATMTTQLRRSGSLLREKVYYRLLRARKVIRQRGPWAHTLPARKTILLIVGCQRSGTTLMNQIFEHDLRARVYPEVSELSSSDMPKRLRLNPLTQVRFQLAWQPASLVVLKPLVESQRTLELLDTFEQPRPDGPILTARAVWLYRHYRDVAASYVKKWGAGHSARDLRAIVEQHSDNWRSELLSEEVVETVRSHYREEMGDYDASALYWWVRNRLFYDRGLAREPRVMLCPYDALVMAPVQMVEAIYAFIGQEFPGPQIVASVHREAKSKGASVVLAPAIEELCAVLLARLDESFTQQASLQADLPEVQRLGR